MIEEHVIKIAELQAELEAEEAKADEVSAMTDACIADTKGVLAGFELDRKRERAPYVEAAEELKTTIGDLYATIIDEWTGENKTMSFAAGTLKFTTRGSLKIHDEAWLLSDILDRMTVEDLIKKKYLKGFNLTQVKQYMSVIDLPIDVAEIEYKTTVKLEQKSG
jgi:phage host-nuclease inhibitor protein Gam